MLPILLACLCCQQIQFECEDTLREIEIIMPDKKSDYFTYLMGQKHAYENILKVINENEDDQ